MDDLFSQIPERPKDAYRVIHSADWHLGKPLGDLSRMDEHRAFLDFLLQAIQEHQVDALLVAGDIFDSAHPPQQAVNLYFDFIDKLYRDTSCIMVVTAGNHDSPPMLEAPRKVLESLRVQVVGAYPEKRKEVVIALPDETSPQLYVAAIPFLRDRDLRTGALGESQQVIREQLTKGIKNSYQQAVRAINKVNADKRPIVAMGHLTVNSCETCPDSEREIHIGGLGAVDDSTFPAAIDYLALGHLHRPQGIGSKEHFRYSGSPIPLSFAESGDEKEVRVLDFNATELVGNYRLRIPLFRRLIQWHLERDELELYLKIKQPPKSKLRPWVEVVVKDPVAGENLFEIVREYARGRPFEVVRVIGKAQSKPEAFRLGELSSDTDADNLLADPKRVFFNRLREEENLTEPERVGLITAFDELLDLERDQ